MVYEMNDLKGILFLVLLKIISITSTNIDCSGNAFHCVNSTHFMICVDLGGGVSITIDDFIIPCPWATVCERNNRFECEYPKISTTPYPLGVIGVTKQNVLEITNDTPEETFGYVTGLPETINLVTTTTVTEEVTTPAIVELLVEGLNLETDANVQSASELTTVNYSNTPNTINDVNKNIANAKIQTSTHESMSSPSKNLFKVESIIESALDRPEIKNTAKEILWSKININETNNSTNIIYDTTSNKGDFTPILNNRSFTNETEPNERVPLEILYTSTVNKQHNNSDIENNVHHNDVEYYTRGLSGISNDKLAHTSDQAPSTVLNYGHLTLNANNMQNATNFIRNAVFTTASTIFSADTTSAIKVTEYSGVNKTKIVNENSTKSVLVNDFLTSQITTETPLTGSVLFVDQVNMMSTEAANIQDIIVTNNLTIELINRTDHNNLNSQIYQGPSTITTEKLTTNITGTQTEIPLETTSNAFINEYHYANNPILKNDNNTETLLANEFITAETTLTDNVTSQASTSASEATFIQDAVKTSITDLVHQSEYTNVHTEVYEKSKDGPSSVNLSTIDQVPSQTVRSTTNLSNTQSATNNDQRLSSTMPTLTILESHNKSPIEHLNESNTTRTEFANNINPVLSNEFMTTTDISNTDIALSTIQMNSLSTGTPYIEDVHVDHSLKDIVHNTKDNNITSGITHETIVYETTTEQVPSITTSERFTSDYSSTKTVTSYEKQPTIATTTETSSIVLITDNRINETRIADESITTMTSFTVTDNRSLFTDQVNTMPTEDPYIQDIHLDKNPNYDVVVQSNYNKVLTKAYKKEVMNTTKTVETIFNQSLSTPLAAKDFDLILNNTKHQNIKNFEHSSIFVVNNSPQIETTSLNLITEYENPDETTTIKDATTEQNVFNEIKTTTTSYFKENLLFTDHVNIQSKEASYIQDEQINSIPIAEQFNKSKLNELNHENKQVNIKLRFINDTLFYETRTMQHDVPIPALTEELFISNLNLLNVTNNQPKVNFSSIPLDKMVTPSIADFNDIKTNDKELVTTSKSSINDNVLLTDKINTSTTEETYHDMNLNIPVNQTNLNNLHDFLSTETSALITETLVNEIGIPDTELLTTITLTESYNSSYYIQQHTTDRIQIVNVPTIPAETIITTLIPDHVDNSSQKAFIQVNPIITELYQDITESSATSWTLKEIVASNGTNTIVPSTIGTDELFELDFNNTGNITYNNNNISTIMNPITLPTHSTLITVLKEADYNKQFLEEFNNTKEKKSAESVIFIDKSHKESQVDMNIQDIVNKNPIAEPIDQKEFQKLHDRFVQNNKDTIKGINNETPITEITNTEGIPLMTTESVGKDLIGLSSTHTNELQNEKSISIVSNAQNTLQSDDIIALSNIREGRMTTAPMEPITDKTNKAGMHFDNKKPVQYNTPTPPLAVVETINTATSSVPFETSTNLFVVENFKKLITAPQVKTLDSHADNILELTTPMTQTANLIKEILLDNRTENTLVSTIPYSSSIKNPSSESTSIFSSIHVNMNTKSGKNNSDLGINTLDTSSNVDNSRTNIVGKVMRTKTAYYGSGTNIISTTDTITEFPTNLAVGNTVTELPTQRKNMNVYPVIEVSSPGDLGVNKALSNSTFQFYTVTESAAAFSEDTGAEPITNQTSLQMISVSHDDKQNITNINNNMSNSEAQNLKKVASANAVSNKSIPGNINSSWLSIQTITNSHNFTDNVFTMKDNEPSVEIPRSITESPTLENTQNINYSYSGLSLTSQSEQIVPLGTLDIKNMESNQTITLQRSSIINTLNTSTHASSTGTLEPIKYLKTLKNLYAEANVKNRSDVLKQDNVGLHISNTNQETMNNSSHLTQKLVIINVNLSEPRHNQGELKEQVSTDNQTLDIQNNKQSNHTINMLKHSVNITTSGHSGITNISNKNIVNGFHFTCLNRSRGKYADNKNCRKFYNCIGRPQPLAGTCPLNTVFSEINKQCTRNLSHCVRNNQFRCLLEGRFSDFFNDNVYYICIKNNSINNFVRYKLQCLSGFHLNKAAVRCECNIEVSSVSASSVSDSSQKSNDNSESQQNSGQNQEASSIGSFECVKEGKFPYPEDCRKYYLCYKNSKSEYRRKIKECSSDEVYHNEKKNCVESESYGC